MQTRRTMNSTKSVRQGFTLIEVLMVIAIIGVLVAIAIPALNVARQSILQSAIALETTTIANAIEQYKQKFGDYPPDGSNAAVLRRHLQKVFPQIATSEISLLIADVFPGTSTPLVNFTNAPNPNGVMDPPEALVFFLGGFSSDPVYPFSGVGGPIFITNSSGAQVTSVVPTANRGSVQYNVDRNEPLFEFQQGQLTVTIDGGITVSNDESSYSLGSNDVLPAYHPSGKLAPFVFFDKRSYYAGGFYNHYGNAMTSFGVARPYRSDLISTTASTAEDRYRYMNEDSFQVLTAGLDDQYGGIPWDGTGNGPVFFSFPSGNSINFGPSTPTVGDFSAYSDGTGIKTQLDNATNFSEGILGNSLPN